MVFNQISLWPHDFTYVDNTQIFQNVSQPIHEYAGYIYIHSINPVECFDMRLSFFQSPPVMFNIFTNTDDNCVLVRSARCGRQYKFNCTPTYQHITSALNHINAANTLIASELDKLVHTQLQATVYGLNGSSTENITVNILEIAILHNLYKTANLIVQQYAQQLPGDLDQMYELLLMSQMNDMIGRFI